MVNRILRLFSREVSGVHQAAYLLAVFALGSQVLALFRDRLLAHFFGAGAALDVYYAAFRIPDFIFTTVGSIVALSVVIPFLVDRLEHDRAEAKMFLDNIVSFFMVLIMVVIGTAFVLMPYLAKVMFPGFAGKEYTDLVMMARILLLSPLLLGISNIFGAVTQSFRRFFIYGLSPIFYNAGIILGIIVFTPKFGVYGVVYGVVLGAALHAGIQLPFIIKERMFPRLRLHFFTQATRRSIMLSIPRTLGLGASHISLIVLIAFASTFAAGSIAIFNFAYNLQSIPLTIIGVSYSLAAFPTLAKAFSQGDHEKFFTYISTSTRHIIFWSMPIIALFIVLRAHIIRVILGSGQFSWSDTRLTAAAFALFTLSVVFQSLILLFARGMYAMGKTSLPVIANVFGAGLIVVCAFVFAWLFNHFGGLAHLLSASLRVNDLPDTAVLVLPLAFSVGSAVNCFVLWWAFQKKFPGLLLVVGRTTLQGMVASVLAGLATYLSLNLTDSLFNLDRFLGILSHGLLAGVIGGCVWLLVILALQSRELKEMTESLKKRFLKTGIVGPDAEVI